jgi:predicted RND superfamily exporter protein
MHRHFLHRQLLLGMLWVVTHPKRTLAGALLVLLGCGLLAFFKLQTSTDQDELFSSKVAFFDQYIKFTQNFPEHQASYVMIEPADPSHPPATARWIAVADAITDRLRKDTANVNAADSHIPLKMLGNQGILFDDPSQLHQDFNDAQQLSVLFREANLFTRRMGATPLQRFFTELNPTGTGGIKLTPQSAQFAKMIADGLTAAITRPDEPITLGNQVPDLNALGETDPAKLGYYYLPQQNDPSRHLMLINVYEHDDFSRSHGLADTINAIRADMYQAAKPFPDFHVSLTGRPALEADEMATTDADARTSEIAALSAVFIGLVLLLRSLWIAVAAELALLIGIGWTFGWATVSVHRLNLLSMVFIIALTGIGMDYLIQVLTRYRRESARRSSPRGIWTGVFKYVAAPINTACLGAAGAFFVSIFTNFRGAAELGIVASGGLLLCLLTGYVILPPLLTLFPAKPRLVDAEYGDPKSRARSKRAADDKSILADEKPLTPYPAYEGAEPTQSPWRHLWLVPPFAWAILLLVGIPFALRAQFNPSLLKMQAQSLESVKQVQKLQTWSAAVLENVDDSRDARHQLAVLRKVQNAVAHLPTVDHTESLLSAYENQDWLRANKVASIDRTDYEPITPANLPGLKTAVDKLASAAQASRFNDLDQSLNVFSNAISQADPVKLSARLSTWQQIFITQLKAILATFDPPAFDPQALPESLSLRSHLIGKDGRFVLYIYPKKDLWKQDDLRDFVLQVEQAVKNSMPDAPPVTGIAVNVYHSTSDIEKSFYQATGYALGLIFLLVLIDLRHLFQTLLAISVLAMGLPMLVALMGLFQIDWNFANFFGLPILIGAGHEYGVFMVHRYNEAASNPHRRWRAWDVSDKALLLCAYVTSVSFGFFYLLGHHEGLKSLGLVMALGTMSIYLATLCVLRPLLLWKLSRRDPAHAAREPKPFASPV